MAYQGIDLLDAFRGRISARKLYVLLKALPADAPLWGAIKAAEEAALKPQADQIRDRTKYWADRGN